MSIKLLTDSGIDLSQELAERLNIKVLPLTTICNGVEYLDGVEISSNELNERMTKGDVFTTTQITVDQYTKAFKEEVEKGNDIILLTLSSGITGTINSARLARGIVLEEHPDAVIEIIDSKLASYSFGILAMRMAEYIKAGLGMDELLEKAKDLIDNVYVAFTVDDLQYLHRGGRISSMQKVVGGMLNIKPVMIVDDEGRLVSVDKARGLKKVYAKFVEMIREAIDEDVEKDQLVIIGHTLYPSQAMELKKLLEKEFGFTNIQIGEIGAVISSHTGPGCIEITLLKRNLKDQEMNLKM